MQHFSRHSPSAAAASADQPAPLDEHDRRLLSPDHHWWTSSGLAANQVHLPIETSLVDVCTTSRHFNYCACEAEISQKNFSKRNVMMLHYQQYKITSRTITAPTTITTTTATTTTTTITITTTTTRCSYLLLNCKLVCGHDILCRKPQRQPLQCLQCDLLQIVSMS